MLGRCPRCSSSLSEAHRDEVHLLACAGCGGVWMNGATLHRFVEALQQRPEAVQAAEAVSDRALFDFEVDEETLGCPKCKAPMEVTRHPSGVALDVCADHGVWFDRDELPRVVNDPEGLAAAQAVDERVAQGSSRSVGLAAAELGTDAVVVTAEVAHLATGVGGMAADAGDVADVAGASVEAAGGALEFVGDVASGAVGLVFGVLSLLDPT